MSKYSHEQSKIPTAQLVKAFTKCTQADKTQKYKDPDIISGSLSCKELKDWTPKAYLMFNPPHPPRI